MDFLGKNMDIKISEQTKLPPNQVIAQFLSFPNLLALQGFIGTWILRSSPDPANSDPTFIIWASKLSGCSFNLWNFRVIHPGQLYNMKPQKWRFGSNDLPFQLGIYLFTGFMLVFRGVQEVALWQLKHWQHITLAPCQSFTTHQVHVSCNNRYSRRHLRFHTDNGGK